MNLSKLGILVALVGALLAPLGGCADSGGGGVVLTGDMKGTGGDGGGGGNACTPGDARSCICLGGGMGTQVCRDTGTSYGSCGGCTGDAGTIVVGDAGAIGNPCGDCQGCCDGTACIAFGEQTNSQCGATGTTCTSCGGKTCNTADGTCVTAGSSGCGSCTGGCCGTLNGAAHCYVDTASACGTGGGACTACTAGTKCSAGTCDDSIDPNHMFKVTVESAQVFNTDGMGSCWDGFASGCGQPDLYTCFAYDPGTGYVAGCTSANADVPVDNGKPGKDDLATDSTMWTGGNGVIRDSNNNAILIPGSAFINGKVLVFVKDQDPALNTDEVLGSSFIQGSKLFAGFMVGPWGRVVSVVFTLQ